MSRPLRVEFPGAIYHVMCRGNGRQQIFHDDGDYQRLLDGLALTVNRYGWEMSIRSAHGLARPSRTRACPQLAGFRPLISAGFIPQWLRTMGSILSLSETFVPSPSAETLPHGSPGN